MIQEKQQQITPIIAKTPQYFLVTVFGLFLNIKLIFQ